MTLWPNQMPEPTAVGAGSTFFVRHLTAFTIHLPGGRGPHEAAPIIIVIVCSVGGLMLLFKGMRGDIVDECGIAKAPRWLYLISGVVLQMPAFIYAYAIKAAN